MSYLINQITQQLLNEQIAKSRLGTGPGYYVPASTSVWVSQSDFWDKIGISDFTVSAEFTVHNESYIIASQVSGNDLSLNKETIKIGSGASVSLPNYSFNAGSRYSVCVSADRDGLAAYYVNGKLIGSVDISSSAAVSLSGTFYAFRGAPGISQTGHGLRVFNRALTATEVEQVSNGQNLGFADYGASGIAGYTSDFSANADGWITSVDAVVAGNIDGVSDGVTSKDNVLRITHSGGASLSQIQKTSGFIADGKRYKIKYEYYIPSSNAVVDGFSVRRSSGTLGLQTGGQTVGQWATFEAEITSDNTNSGGILIGLADGGSIAPGAGASGDVVYIASMSFTQVGLVLDLNEWGMSPTQWFDHSGNSYNGAITGATRINPISLAADKHVSLTNLPTSASGLAAGRVWNDAGTLKIVT